MSDIYSVMRSFLQEVGTQGTLHEAVSEGIVIFVAEAMYVHVDISDSESSSCPALHLNPQGRPGPPV